MNQKLSTWHVAIAAEAFVAAVFARYGYDVSVQYGANQPEYDLIVAKGEKMLKISVKGSQTGAWGLTQSYLKNADYQQAIKEWLTRHHAKTLICFVQFKGISYDEMPRMYLATPEQVAKRLEETAMGRGATRIYEYKQWTTKIHGSAVDKIPENWKLSVERIEEMFNLA